MSFAHPAPEFVQALFNEHDRPHDCDSFDQASHADLAPAVIAFDSVTMPPVSVSSWHAAWHVAAQASGFLARAPPPLS